MESLAQSLTERLPGGLAYRDAVQLCLRLYCTANGVPQQFHQRLTKEGLMDTFVALSEAGWIHGRSANSKEHWAEVIASASKSPNAVDIARGTELMRQLKW
jgi:hypothetical protein